MWKQQEWEYKQLHKNASQVCWLLFLIVPPDQRALQCAFAHFPFLCLRFLYILKLIVYFFIFYTNKST